MSRYRLVKAMPSAVQTPGTPRPTYHLVFDGSDDIVAIDAAASIDDLPLGDFTVEFVAKDMDGAIVTKSDGESTGWQIYESNNGSLTFYVGATEEGVLVSLRTTVDDPETLETVEGTDFSAYHHYAVVFVADPQDAKIYVDGAEASYAVDSNEAGTYSGDGIEDLRLFSYSGADFAAGSMRWLRISNIARYTEAFDAPSLVICPGEDENTVLRLDLDEGAGDPVDTSGSGNTATLTGATWEADS